MFRWTDSIRNTRKKLLFWSNKDKESENLWELNSSRSVFLVIYSLASCSTKNITYQVHQNKHTQIPTTVVLVAQDSIPYHFLKYRKDCFSILLDTVFWRKCFISILYKIDVKMLDFLIVCFILSLRLSVSPFLHPFFFFWWIPLKYPHFWEKMTLD